MPRYINLALATLIFFILITPVNAQTEPEAWTTYLVNMRTGSGTDYSVITTLKPDTALIVEARNADLSWVLAHTSDNTAHG